MVKKSKQERARDLFRKGGLDRYKRTVYHNFHKKAYYSRKFGWKRYFNYPYWYGGASYPIYSRRTEIQYAQRMAKPQVTIPRFQPPRVVDTSRPLGAPPGTFVDRYASLRYSKEDLPYQYRNKDWNIYTPQEYPYHLGGRGHSAAVTPSQEQQLKELQRQDRLMWESIHSRMYWKSFLWGQRLPGNMGDLRFAGAIRQPRTTKFKWWDILNKGKIPQHPTDFGRTIPHAGGPKTIIREPCFHEVYVPSLQTWKTVPCSQKERLFYGQTQNYSSKRKHQYYTRRRNDYYIQPAYRKRFAKPRSRFRQQYYRPMRKQFSHW